MASALLTAAVPSYDTFKASLDGEVVRPGEDGYEFGIARWTPTAMLPAQYVVFPKTNEDISKAIKFSRAINIEIAVCCGGHSWSGTSSTRGLLIHLGKYMNSVRCDPDAKVVCVGGGALWKAVDEEAIKHGLATVAGTVNHTGVAGLALGGGIGWLSGRHGLVVDNTIQYTVVLASGEVVTANEKEHPDLFWGMRGGGSNFGIATEFVFKAHPQRPTVFLTRLIFPADRVKEVTEALESWYETITDDEMALFACMRMPPTFEPALLIMYYYNGEPEEGRNALKKIYDLGPMAEIPSERLPYEELNGVQNDSSRPGVRTYGNSFGLPKFTPEIASTCLDLLEKTVAAEPKFQNSIAMVEFIPKRVICSVPSSATAFPTRGLNRELLLAVIQTDPELDGKQRDEVRGWNARIKALLKGHTGHGYANYDGDGSKGAATLFGENYPRLQTVKARYDPDKVFTKWFPIEPASE